MAHYRYYILYKEENDPIYQMNPLESDNKKDMVEDLKIILNDIFSSEYLYLIYQIYKRNSKGEYVRYFWEQALCNDLAKYRINIDYNNQLVKRYKTLR